MKIMTKKEFQNGMNSIPVNYETKEEVWSRLCEKQLQEANGFSVRTIMKKIRMVVNSLSGKPGLPWWQY